ncbi:unnamed protein product [Arctia plantaginis]|uniref:Uncharacterized protein n=1 Tax=Arctia plantaginis TaxID=874455 RepID=A0A8S1BR56_ARCPL|nr:unnamed protein product [Arctia plantaginis]
MRAFSLPITQDVRASDIGLQSEIEIEPQSDISSSLDEELRRTKRNTMRSKGCSRGKRFYKTRCITYTMYTKIIEGDYDDGE